MNCILCQIKDKEIPYQGIIKEWKYWTVMLSREQHTLGTLVILYNTHLVRFSSIVPDALMEFQRIQHHLEKSIDTLFSPDLYNYLQCGNHVEHLHIHMIPRYKTNILFDNQTFTDRNYGNSVEETSKIESDDLLKTLTSEIIKNLY
ncbi:HIT family protein [Flavobacterium sp. KACC 22763]|uniref:HIT family protein n=1 Tax=Flavobacterium sp. KACC 22763 TaxID=3025668 RepID=UPI0023668150|nr:HIT family protein [Flavobacterium sp. KACC 22763]WDF65960.1 HIT family protein [Flavobacterium sp. KACC 22763]